MQGIPTPEATDLTTGTTGLAVLAAETQAEALAAIGAEEEVEVITNSNGTAIRLPGSGIQICIFDPATPATTTNVFNALYFSSLFTRTFPAAFNDLPKVTPATRFVVGESASVCWGAVEVVTATTCSLYAFSGGTLGSCRLGYIAIGPYTP